MVDAVRRLLVSVHDASPGVEPELRHIHAALEESGIGSRYCLFLVPDFWNREPLAGHPGFTSWVRELSASGVEIALHGYTHLAPGTGGSIAGRMVAGLLSAGEEEFHGLSKEEAASRITKGLAALREVLGEDTDPGFVAPAWLYSRGTKRALEELGVPWTEDHAGVRFPTGKGRFIRSPVVCFATRTPVRRMLSVLWSLAAPQLLAPFGTVRLALHPADLSSPALHGRLPSLLRRFSGSREICRYSSLAGGD